MKKKRYAAILLLSVIVVAGGYLAAKKWWPVMYEKEAGPIMQVISADMKHERTISWKTAAAGEAGSLELRQAGGSQLSRITADSVELPADNGGAVYRLYTAHLTNLQPGTRYEYRVMTGKRQSVWREFITEPENGAFTAFVFGDSQASNYGVWGKTAQTAWEQHKDAAFFINMGDIVDNGQDESQWNAWFAEAGNLLTAIPVAPVMGNHEAYSLAWKMALPEYYLKFFATPPNGPPGLARYAYSFDYGDVHFSVINTQQHELQEWQPELLTKQKQWLARDLAQTTKKWKVVLMHRGVWEFPFKGPLDNIGQTFVPIFDAHKVDLVFTAHVHVYARTKALKNGQVPDPYGTVYITTGRSGEKVWEKSPQKPLDVIFYNPLDMPNYLVLDASADSLKIRAFKQNGEPLDQTELKK